MSYLSTRRPAPGPAHAPLARARRLAPLLSLLLTLATELPFTPPVRLVPDSFIEEAVWLARVEPACRAGG